MYICNKSKIQNLDHPRRYISYEDLLSADIYDETFNAELHVVQLGLVRDMYR